MDEKGIIRISVRNFVEFILRSGDIDNRISSSARQEAMLAGGKIHRKIQRREGSGYLAEVPLKIELEQELYTLVIEGRADGIKAVKERIVIDEIKGIFHDVHDLKEPVPVHLAQAKCYAYIYASQANLPEIEVQMTYCNLDTEEIRRFHSAYIYEELEQWFMELVAQYDKWANFQFQWHRLRNDSIRTLAFPFAYREGQKKLAASVYTSILRRKNLFVQAPTGTGKTMSVLFPAVKAVGENLSDKIFYLTAKTVTRAVAKEAAAILKEHGYQAKVLEITAKEKLCLLEEMECNPVHCPYAKGHYDRVNDAVFDLLQKQDDFFQNDFLEQAQKHMVCPFELCLDTASWADLIICDYNYAFDPNVHLKRFFSEGVKGEYLFLIDEAHNLVERARKMYSAVLYKEDILSVKKTVKPYSRKVEKQLEACNRKMLEKKKECEDYIICGGIGDFVFALMRLASSMDDFLREKREFPKRKEVVEFYMNLRHFLNIAELVDENYVTYYEKEANDRFALHLYCIGTAVNLQEYLNRGNSAVFFSATLLPVNYYKKLLTTQEDCYAVYAHTVFSSSQSCILVAGDVSSKYTRRTNAEFEKIASYIIGMVEQKKGNYIAFFPSYKMMEQVLEQFYQMPQAGWVDCIVQENSMNEASRKEFLEEFSRNRKRSLCAFCVMGGIFGEGIDLKEEQLIGVAVVGTGLPQVCQEQEILKQYYEENGENGFAYAYTYPGMNKVLQAAGRVIRTARDRGVILLLDDRFYRREYREMFPREWAHAKRCSLNNFREELRKFWES